jgi:hypothetical protein
MSDAGEGPDGRLERALAEPVSTDAGYRPFGEMTIDQVAARATELEGAAGIAAMQRVASVAAVWRGLARAMERAGAATVADLDRSELLSRVDRLWVTPPGGSLI